MSKLIPIMIKVVDNAVYSAVVCQDAAHLEAVFTREATKEGVEVCLADLDNGYVESDGSTFCMTWAETEDGADPAVRKQFIALEEYAPVFVQFNSDSAIHGNIIRQWVKDTRTNYADEDMQGLDLDFIYDNADAIAKLYQDRGNNDRTNE